MKMLLFAAIVAVAGIAFGVMRAVLIARFERNLRAIALPVRLIDERRPSDSPGVRR